MGSLRGTRVFWSRTLLHVMKNCSVECDAGYGPTPKHVKNPETDRGHGEEIDGDQLLGAILQECAPGLRRRFAAAHHVFADAAFTDVDAEFEQFAMDGGCPPTGILSAHLADQISDFARNDGSPGLAVPHLPDPEQAKAGAMPGYDCFWLDDGQGRAPVVPKAGQTEPQQAVPRGQFWAFSCGPPKHADLWRRARFSTSRAARERKIEDSIARSVVREMSIAGE